MRQLPVPPSRGTVKADWDRVLNLTLWILQCLLALAFLYFGASKFSPHEIFWIETFAKIGIGQWFRYFTGSLEVICAVLLLIPRTSAIAAALLACTMAGATLTHIFTLRDRYVALFPAFFLLILIAVARRRRFGSRAVKEN
ncbi:DoxX family protein [Alloacidobacterium dinghuense]|uniref:DoxX family protein n=1 Tax=Alloacidobacterium dinghuense TaxID=2763107 RepID=UPI003D80784E